MPNEKPWWWPERTDEAWCQRCRDDYPERASDWDDDTIREYYNDGWGWSDTWDHLGDAREEYEKLAEAFLKLVAETGKTPSDFNSI